MMTLFIVHHRCLDAPLWMYHHTVIMHTTSVYHDQHNYKGAHRFLTSTLVYWRHARLLATSQHPTRLLRQTVVLRMELCTQV